MEHSITIEENPVDDSNTTEENPVYEKHCITKVHVGLRNVKPKAYKPVVVSIGPYYHKCNPNLEAMQQIKQKYLGSLLKRRNGSRANYHSKLAKLETKARKCYADPMSTINDKEFTEMMLLDSCFVVEFLRKMHDEVDVYFHENEPIYRVQWMQNQIQCDMMLLENQLPYFVLSEFYNMTKYEGEKSLEEMAMSCFNFMLPRPRLYFSYCEGGKSLEQMASKGEINHLLHLVHIFCRPSVPKEKKPSVPKGTKRSSDESTSAQRHDSSAKEVGKSRNFNDNSDHNCPLLEKSPEDSVGCIKDILCCCGSVNRKRDNEQKNHIGTVVELQEAGVNFEKVGEVYNGELIKGTWNDYVSLFDIEFKCRGVMKVPCFKVDASTETLLRNLIAYEQEFFNDVEPKYFTDFAMLMNQLINSEKDTKVLRYQEIIINFLPDDKDVSKLFNTLIVGVCDSYESYFLKVRENVDEHCKIPCKIWLAYFNRNYCYNPCVCASSIAAAILLIISLLTWLDIYP